MVENSARSLTLSGNESAPQTDDSLITFEDCIEDQIIGELRAVDINAISPFEAMTLLYDLKKRLMD